MASRRAETRPGLRNFDSVRMCNDRLNSPIVDSMTEIKIYFAVRGADRQSVYGFLLYRHTAPEFLRSKFGQGPLKNEGNKETI